MKVNLVAKSQGGTTGISRYAQELYCGLKTRGLEVELIEPEPVKLPAAANSLLKRRGLDAEAFFTTYPLSVHLNGDGIVHLASQNLATLLLFRRVSPVVITVHDIIPYLLRRDRRLSIYRHPVHRFFDRLSLLRLKKAQAIIADSGYTREMLVEHLAISEKKIQVVPLGVNKKLFRPTEAPDGLLSKYGLNRDTQYIIYVGSEDPRKNLEVLLNALARIRKDRGNVQLLKIGAARFMDERQRVLHAIRELDLEDRVRFIDQVTEEELAYFYSLAAVFAFPSKYEGFGLPTLEAMACGTPVVASKASSIPEVVGDAGLLVSPEDPKAWAEAILSVLDNPGLGEKMAADGLERASEFSWERTAERTIEVYQELDKNFSPTTMTQNRD